MGTGGRPFADRDLDLDRDAEEPGERRRIVPQTAPRASNAARRSAGLRLSRFGAGLSSVLPPLRAARAAGDVMDLSELLNSDRSGGPSILRPFGCHRRIHVAAIRPAKIV